MWRLTACKISDLELDQKWFFLSYLWINVANIIQKYDKSRFIFD